MGGRKIVEPHLADALKSRNHILDDIFSVKKINVEVKNKAAEDTEESSTPDDLIDSDGRHIVEKVGVSMFFFVILVGTDVLRNNNTNQTKYSYHIVYRSSVMIPVSLY